MKSVRCGDESCEVSAVYDYFIFMGDCNFRVDYEYEAAVNLIESEE